MGAELLLGPILGGELVIGQAGDALRLHTLEEVRRIAFAIEHQREAMCQWIGLQLLGAGLLWNLMLKARHDVLLENLNQSRIDHLVDDKNGCPSMALTQ